MSESANLNKRLTQVRTTMWVGVHGLGGAGAQGTGGWSTSIMGLEYQHNGIGVPDYPVPRGPVALKRTPERGVVLENRNPNSIGVEVNTIKKRRERTNSDHIPEERMIKGDKR